MKDVLCEIIKNEEIAPDIFDMTVRSAEIVAEAKCGQFSNILCGENFLRRPISICEIGKDTVRYVYQAKGKGTRWMAERRPGEQIKILGPLGNGFQLKKMPENAVIIGGGIGVPPMLETLKAVGGNVILGFRSKNEVILKDEFKEQAKSLTITTNDGSEGIKGFVTAPLEERLKQPCDMILACGPIPMLRAVAKTAADFGVPCQVSMEERMGCGVGACLVCVCKIKMTGFEGYQQVCKRGPVFDAKSVDWAEIK